MTAKPAVLIIVENLPVPLDRRVWQEARTLTEAGYRVSIICIKGKGQESSYEKLEGIEIYRHRIWEASGALGYLFEYLWAFIAELWLALRIYARTRFRVIQACNPPDMIFLVALFFKPLGVRFIFDHHDLNPELFEAKFNRRNLFYRLVCLAERLTFRTADVSIATNQSYREVAISRGGMAPERVFVVRSCPELARFRLRSPNPTLKRGRRYLLAYVGVMGPQDGLDLLLESLGYVLQRYSEKDVLLVLIGAGTETGNVEAMAKRQGLDSAILFTGRIPDEELADYLSTADVCVAPDPKSPMNDKSTMNKILEYMAYAGPVVLYDLTEGRRSAGDCALYARPNDPRDFANCIATLLESESLRRRLGQCGRSRIEKELNWESEKKSLLAAYECALS